MPDPERESSLGNPEEIAMVVRRTEVLVDRRVPVAPVRQVMLVGGNRFGLFFKPGLGVGDESLLVIECQLPEQDSG